MAQASHRRGQGLTALPFTRSWHLRGRSHTLCACLMVLAPALLGAPASAQTSRADWQIGTSPSFSTGRYGTDTRTDVLHTPITARRLFDSGDLTLVFPFTCITGDGGVTLVSGSPVRTTDGHETRTGGTTSRPLGGDRNTGTTAGTGRGTTDASTEPTVTRTIQRVNNCGLGDIVVRGRFYLVDERGWVPTIAVRGHVKAPTARAEIGLGTGRPDEGVGIEVSRSVPGGLLAMVDAGYTIVGQPADVDFSNTWWYDVGLGWNLAGGAVNVSAFFEEYSAIVPGLASARDLLGAVSVRGAGGWRLQVSGQVGLSEGAPDHGFALGASRRF